MTAVSKQEVTIVIKTFNRKKSLITLLSSIKKMGYSFPILIADDSKEPYKEEILAGFPYMDIHYHVLPFDTGLSAGRNYLLHLVKTPYFILCDDDVAFHSQSNIAGALSTLKENDLDIGGGTFMNYITITGLRRFLGVMTKPRQAFHFLFSIPVIWRYAGHFQVEGDRCTLVIRNRSITDPVYACDVTNNIFIARTDSVLKINGWDESFKLGEHEDFFYRAKLQGLKIGFINNFSVRHYPAAWGDYLRFRERSLELKKNFPRKFSFMEYTEINSDTGKVLFSYRAYENEDRKD